MVKKTVYIKKSTHEMINFRYNRGNSFFQHFLKESDCPDQ